MSLARLLEWVARTSLPGLLTAGVLCLSCKSGTEPDPHSSLTLQLDAVPLLLKADSTGVATVWATVLEDGLPVSDSTVVSFAATLGHVDAEAFTRDGLARAVYEAGPVSGIAAIIAQVRAERDTVLVTIY